MTEQAWDEEDGAKLFASEIRRIVQETLSNTVVAHQRRCAIRACVRESSELVEACEHENWDHGKQWCRDCGVTKEEMVFGCN